MKDCWNIKIGGYEAVVDHRKMIIDCHPRLNKIKYESIETIFTRYKNQLEFKIIERVEYPINVSDDIYNLMVKKNPVLELLREKFNCDIF